MQGTASLPLKTWEKHPTKFSSPGGQQTLLRQGRGRSTQPNFFRHAEEREKSGEFHVPLPAGQALYGGGSYQNGLVNYKGVPFLQHVAVSMDELTHVPRGKWKIMEKHRFFSCQHLDNVFLFLGGGAAYRAASYL